MKNIRSIAILILLISFFHGCKTTRVVVPVTPITDSVSKPAGQLRGYYVHPESWRDTNSVIEMGNVSAVMKKIADENFNIAFFQHGGNTEILTQAVESAHQQGLKIYAEIELPEIEDANLEAALPRLKTDLKKYVRLLVMDYNIDGIYVRTPILSSDLFEDLVVEAMLVKPYLVISIVYSDDSGQKSAVNCLEKGIVDLIIPENELAFANPECLPSIYQNRVKLPAGLKKIPANRAVGLDVSPLFPDNREGRKIKIGNSGGTKVTDSEGKFGFIIEPSDTIKFETPAGSVVLSTSTWSVPFKYTVISGSEVARKSPWVEFRRMPRTLTNTPDFDFLCKTDYPSTVLINGQEVKQYKTGIFFNKVTLKEGINRIRASVITSDSLTTFYEGEYTYEKTDNTRKPFPLWIDSGSVVPSETIELLDDDNVRVSFQGSLGQEGSVILSPGGLIINCFRINYRDYSVYTADVPLSRLSTGTTYTIALRLLPVAGELDVMPYELKLPNTITARELYDFPMVKVRRENSRLVYNLGAPRLGGPVRSELQPGVVMKTNGKIGENYRIRLSMVESGFINQGDVMVLDKESVRPSYSVSSMSCGPGNGVDVLTIPYLEPVVYEVYPDPDQKRIIITLFGVESSSTWVTHRTGRKVIEKITWQQTNPETFQVYVNLKSSDIWGYDVRVEGTRLVLRVKYPPVYDTNTDKPLAGLRIAIEAGHGGTNAGAIGLSGLVEKDVNLDVSFRLGELCKEMGAEVLQIRDSDIDMTLIEKRDMAIAFDADILISIHANAGGTGYLQVPGTSTYWHNPFWAPLAESVYSRLLELGLAEFGVVGSFNYTVTRASQMPAILVEQAFMSHAEDEEKMADPEFRQAMAQKILAGIIEYLNQMKQR